MAGEQSNNERRTDRAPALHLLLHALINLCGTPANTLFKWGFIALMVYWGAGPLSNAVIALAGKNTQADVSVSADINMHGQHEEQERPKEPHDLHTWCISITAFSIFVAFGCFYDARRNRAMKRDTVEALHNRIEMLESKFDPNRSSSGLTKRGETDPGDI